MYKLNISLITNISIFTMVFLGCCRNDKNIEDLGVKIEKYIGYWNTAEFDGIEDVLSEDFELVTSPEYKAEKGIEAFKQHIIQIHTVYPDFKLELQEEFIESDHATGIWTVTATHTGQGKSQTNVKSVSVTGISLIHFQDGKIKDEWIGGNDLFWMQQLGYTLLPPVVE